MKNRKCNFLTIICEIQKKVAVQNDFLRKDVQI